MEPVIGIEIFELSKQTIFEPVNLSQTDLSTKKYSFWIALIKYWHLVLDEKSWIELFTLLRLALNTFGPFLIYYYFCDFSLLVSISAALVTGSVSAAFQYYNENYINWLNKHNNKLIQCIKWYSVEIIFLILPYALVFAPLGIKLNSLTWFEEMITLLVTALFALVSQGIWDLALAYQKGLNKKLNYFDPSKAKVIFNFRFLFISFLSVLCSVIKLSFPDLGQVLFLCLTITGVIYYTYLWLDKRLKEILITLN